MAILQWWWGWNGSSSVRPSQRIWWREKEEWSQYVEWLDHLLEVNKVADADKKRAIHYWQWLALAPTYNLLRNLLAPVKPKDKTFTQNWWAFSKSETVPYKRLVCSLFHSRYLALHWYLNVVHTIRLQTPQGISNNSKTRAVLGAFIPSYRKQDHLGKIQQKPALQPSLLVPATGKSRMRLGPLTNQLCAALDTLSNT